ncbi:MAG TPA: response regulator [Egibacteraceae bacterium]|nr:response regulator [Egibacteraceae bacterium]
MSDESMGAPTILVADDDPDLVALVARRLVKAGYRVVTASDGEEALQQARQLGPQLAVLDVMMPKLSGIEVARRLRASAGTQHIPVILVSAGLPGELVGQSIPADVDAFISKPFSPRSIPNMVEEVLARPHQVG